MSNLIGLSKVPLRMWQQAGVVYAQGKLKGKLAFPLKGGGESKLDQRTAFKRLYNPAIPGLRLTIGPWLLPIYGASAGRQTGSEAWKAARGELGRHVQSKDDNDDASQLVKKNCSIPPSDALASLSLNDPDSHDRVLEQSQGGITQKSDSVSPHSAQGLDSLSKDNKSNISSTSSIRPSEPLLDDGNQANQQVHDNS